MQRDASARMRKAGLFLFIAWAVVFFCGAVGELFGIEFLRDLTDLKRIFLR
ncbi:MAG: hypothetical protein ACYTF8_14530 [Planctomycetota bacterium]